MLEKVEALIRKKDFYPKAALKKEIESYLKNQKIESQVEIKIFGNHLKLCCKNPVVFHFLKLKEKEIEKILEKFPSFKFSIIFH